MADPDWQRIADDLQATTGRRLDLRTEPPDDSDGPYVEGFAWLHITLDGRRTASVAYVRVEGESGEDELARLADALRDACLDEEIWGGWPTCPIHGTHPLDPTVVHDVATWSCPGGAPVAPIGGLVNRRPR